MFLKRQDDGCNKQVFIIKGPPKYTEVEQLMSALKQENGKPFSKQNCMVPADPSVPGEGIAVATWKQFSVCG